YNCYHREHAVAAIQAGKDVFCEKPLATNIEDALAILEAHKQNPRNFVVGFTLRYTRHYRQIKELIAGGEIGQVVSMEFNETLAFNHGAYIHQDWRRHKHLAGTHMLEKCCHDIDVISWLLDGAKAERVASFGGLNFFKPENAYHMDRVGPNPEDGRVAFRGWQSHLSVPDSPFNDDKDIVDNQVAIIEYDNKVRCTFHTNCMAAQHERRCYIVGSEGTIRADFVAGRVEFKKVGWDTPTVVYDTSAIGGHGGGDMILARELLDCMNNDRKLPTGVEEGLISAVTAFGIDEAMETGRVVDMKPFWAKIDEK
ncbi:MAG: Gfo/Idh/MocA family oxidoreductase, partial [Lentisphaerae bacterium]|nr:Gfo/Idh/MocA family oxidoreductase [Lentisphaerota bacterium]